MANQCARVSRSSLQAPACHHHHRSYSCTSIQFNVNVKTLIVVRTFWWSSLGTKGVSRKTREGVAGESEALSGMTRDPETVCSGIGWREGPNGGCMVSSHGRYGKIRDGGGIHKEGRIMYPCQGGE